MNYFLLLYQNELLCLGFDHPSKLNVCLWTHVYSRNDTWVTFTFPYTADWIIGHLHKRICIKNVSFRIINAKSKQEINWMRSKAMCNLIRQNHILRFCHRQRTNAAVKPNCSHSLSFFFLNRKNISFYFPL